jgi:hypothetical protein
MSKIYPFYYTSIIGIGDFVSSFITISSLQLSQQPSSNTHNPTQQNKQSMPIKYGSIMVPYLLIMRTSLHCFFTSSIQTKCGKLRTFVCFILSNPMILIIIIPICPSSSKPSLLYASL